MNNNNKNYYRFAVFKTNCKFAFNIFYKLIKQIFDFVDVI